MKNKKITLGLIIGLSISVAFIGIASAQRKGLKTPNGNDTSHSELRAVTIETWDLGPNMWEVFTDKDSEIPALNKKDDKYEYKPKLVSPQAKREVRLVPGYPRDVKMIDFQAPSGTIPKDYNVLGVMFQFTYPGHNEVTIRPPRSNQKYEIKRERPYVTENDLTNDQQKNPKKEPVQAVDKIYGVELPGVTSAVSVWVCGRGNDYELEGWFEDYLGNTHILKFGSLNFVGWRPLTVKLPVNIPQFTEQYPATRTVVFKQFKVRSTPKTEGGVVYLFFDELKALTDAFEVHFDGANLDFSKEDCERKQKLDKLIVEPLKEKDANYKDPTRPTKDCNSLKPEDDSAGTGTGTK